MSEEIKGIQETADVVKFLGVLTNNVVDAAADGNFAWYEAVKFTDTARALPAAVSGFKEIPAEIADLSEPEAAALSLIFADALDIPGDENEEIVEEGVDIALKFAAFVNKIRKVKQGLTEANGDEAE